MWLDHANIAWNAIHYAARPRGLRHLSRGASHRVMRPHGALAAFLDKCVGNGR
jgi:hypothetical protein